MTDLSSLSNEELDSLIAAKSGSPDSLGLESLSDEELDSAISAKRDAQFGTGGALASGVLQGTAGIGDLVDLGTKAIKESIYPSRLMQALGVKDPETSNIGGLLRKGFDYATGVEDSTGIGKDTYAYKTGQYLPGMLMGPGKLLSNGVMGTAKNLLKVGALDAASAGGGYIGNELGGPAGEFIGSAGVAALPAIGKAAVSSIGPLTKQGALREVGEAVLPFLPEDKLAQAIKYNSKSDLLTGTKTSAEITNSPELALLEQELGSGAENAATYAKFQKETRPNARDFILDQISPQRVVDKEKTGALATDAWQEAYDISKENTKKLYDAIPLDETAPVFGAKIKISDAQKEFYGPGSTQDIPEELKGVLNYLRNPSNKNRLTVRELQNLRSTAEDVARNTIGKDTKANALANATSTALKDVIENTPGVSESWKAANQAYRIHAETFKRGPLKRLSKSLDAAGINPSQVPDKIFSTPEATKQFAKILENNPGAREALKDHIAATISELKTDASKATFINNNKSQLKTILGDDFEYLEAYRKDILSQGNVKGLANATGGSNTKLKLSNVVDRALTGKDASKVNGMWQTLKAFGLGGTAYAHPYIGIPLTIAAYGVQGLKGKSLNLTREALFESLMNPKTLQRALKAAKTPKASVGINFGSSISQTNGLLGLGRDDKAQEASLDTSENDILKSALSKLNETPSKTDMSTLDTPKQKEEFTAKVKTIADDLGADPEHLMKVMKFETGGTLDSAEKNKAGSGATGLIQFMPSTAKELTGEDTKEAAIKVMEDMTPTEQLDYVGKYLAPFKGKLKTLEDMYMAILYPKAVGKDSEYALFKKGTTAYWQNRGLDIDKDGTITKAEAASKVKSYKA